MAAKDNKITEISGEYIHDFDGKTVAYWDNARSRNLKLNKDFSVIFNGRAKTKFDLNLFDGCQSAVFIDNNNDGRAEVVKITNTYNFIVNSVSGNKIYAKFSGDVLDCENDEVNITNSVGKIYDDERISKISEWSVLTVAVSYSEGGKAYYDAVISVSSAFGTVNTITEGDNSETKKMLIDGSWYETDKDVIYENNNSISVGDDVRVYFNAYGKIAVVCRAMLSSKYGFVTYVSYDENSLDDNVLLKIFSEDGELEQLRTADRVTVDSVVIKDQKTIKNKIAGNGEFKGVFVVYTLNTNGELKKIDLPYNEEAGEQPGKDESPDSLHITAKDFKGRNRKVPMSLSGKVFYSASTKVFVIPYDLNSKKYFRVTDKNTFAEDSDYTVDAYQVRRDSYVSDALVRRVESVGEEDIQDYNYLFFFNNIYYVYNDAENEVRIEMEYLKNGKMVRQLVDSDMEEIVKGLKRGDGILFSEDMNNNIMYIKKVYDRETGTYPTETVDWNSGRRNIGGVVDIKYTNHFKLKDNDEVFNANTNETTIAIYDSKTNKLTAGSVSDIIDSTTDEPSKVFMRVYYGIPRSILIIR